MGAVAGTTSKDGSKTTAATKKKTQPKKYPCMCCTEEKLEKDFYKSRHSRVWNYSKQRVLVCKDCLDELLKEYSSRYGEQNALIIICALLDIPYYAEAYKAVIDKNPTFTIGLYTRMLNGGQYKQKVFANTLLDGEFGKVEEVVRDDLDVKWSTKDKRNKNFVLSVVGYDPFEDEGMTDLDKKYCFNTLASYCDTDGIVDDGHKIQSVIELTQLLLQCRKINELLNSEFLRPSPEETTIKNFTQSKANILSSISKLAQDNNISSNFTGASKQGKSTLSYKMKEMIESGFSDIEVNLFDINTSAAMKQIADLSNQSIMEQLTWDSNDYTKMIKEQREALALLLESSDSLKEENRLLKNELALLKESKRGR